MIAERLAPQMTFSRYPASIFGRVNDCIMLPLRMGLASIHFLAFVMVTENRAAIVLHSLPTPFTESEHTTQLDELNTSLAFTFMFMAILSFLFITGILIRHQTLHFVQGMMHLGGAALLFRVWANNLHTDRVWHSMLFFNLLPVVIDCLFLLYERQRRWIWMK